MIAVDASIVLKLFLNEPDSVQVRNQWQQWEQAGEVIIAPSLFWPETLSVLRRTVHRGIITPQGGDRALGVLEKIEIEVREPPGLYRTAWELSQRYNRPTVYDCCYVALAAMTRCDLWTADLRLLNALGPSLPWVRRA